MNDFIIKQKTAYEMSISDWSSDVCSSDLSIVTLKPWDQRKEEHLKSPALVTEIMALNDRIKDAVVFGAPPPPIEGLSSTGGFEAFVQSRNGSDYRALEAATNKLVAAAAGRKELAGVFTSFSAQVPQLRLDIDRNQAKLLGVSVDDLFATLQSTFSSFYINDFNRNGRVYRVQMQADADYRAFAEGLRNVYVRSRDGTPIPVPALAPVSMQTGPHSTAK